VTNPLNGPLEVGIRVLTVLTEAFPDHLDLNRLVLLDHGLLHSADLGGPESLHPPLPLRSSELGMKRERIQEGLEVLVRAGLAQMEPSAEGINFWASDRATSFVRLLETDYAHALSERAAWVVEHFGTMSDADLREAMRSATGHWAEEFDYADPLSSEEGGL
jgi:hypothetical protein